MSLEATLAGDYFGFLAFCRERHAAESLLFWADVQDFKQRFVKQQQQQASPPPTSPCSPDMEEEEDCAATTINTSFRRRVMSTLSISPGIKTSASWVGLKKALGEVASSNSSSSAKELNTTPSKRSHSTFTTSNEKQQQQQRRSSLLTTPSISLQSLHSETSPRCDDERANDHNSPPKFQHGSSLIKIELSMAKNLSLKYGLCDDEIFLVELAQAIFFKYLDVNSPHWICVQPELAYEIEDIIRTGNVTAALFDSAEHVVVSELKTNLFPLYLQKEFVCLSKVPAPPTTTPPLSMEAEQPEPRRSSLLRRRLSNMLI